MTELSREQVEQLITLMTADGDRWERGDKLLAHDASLRARLEAIEKDRDYERTGWTAARQSISDYMDITAEMQERTLQAEAQLTSLRTKLEGVEKERDEAKSLITILSGPTLLPILETWCIARTQLAAWQARVRELEEALTEIVEGLPQHGYSLPILEWVRDRAMQAITPAAEKVPHE